MSGNEALLSSFRAACPGLRQFSWHGRPSYEGFEDGTPNALGKAVL